MSFPITSAKKRRKVHFVRKMPPQQSPAQAPTAKLDDLLSSQTRIEELSDSASDQDGRFVDFSEEEEAISELTSFSHQLPPTPSLFTAFPPIRDDLATETSELQENTIKECLPCLQGQDAVLNSHGVPKLQRHKHLNFLRGALGPFPPQFAAMDAARPWMVYWALSAMSMLGENMTEMCEEVISTFRPCQNPTGGFGGGYGQLSHLAPSYAAVLSLVTVGGEDALNLIDRRAMWRWLGRMKQRDGGFTMCEGGEQDVRGAYCAMVIVSLLNLPLELPAGSPARAKGDETFLTGLAEWVSRCQTYEGGIGAAPGNEAHGAYAFCALACLCIIGKPHETVNKYFDVPAFLHWLSSRQYAPEGGFAGRTNKLVDGCYSHWVGGCWALLEAALSGAARTSDGQKFKKSTKSSLDGHVWSREGLVRYILGCCQGKRGGLRDKPSKPPDSYHTCYNLAGLSAAQHHYYYGGSLAEDLPSLTAAFDWKVGGIAPVPEVAGLLDEDDVVQPIHPVFVVPWGRAERTKKHFEGRVGF